MAYIKPSVLVYQELANAGGVANVTPDLGTVMIGPLFNVVRVDPTNADNLNATLGASTEDILDDVVETVPGGPSGPFGLRIDLKNTFPGQDVEQSSIVIHGSDAYVRTIQFDLADVRDGEDVDFDNGLRSTVVLSSTGAYIPTFLPAVEPQTLLPDGNGEHIKVGDAVDVTWTIGLTTTVHSTRVAKVVKSSDGLIESISLAEGLPTIADASPVVATVRVYRFYDYIVVPNEYTVSNVTTTQVDFDTANDDYIYLMADGAYPAAYAEVTAPGVTPDEYELVSGKFHLGYRALRQDKYSDILTINDSAERLALLGEATELNPLGLAVDLALANTTTSVMAVSLKKEGGTLPNVSYDWTRALELVENQRSAYALVPLTQDLAVLAQFKAHVEQMSTPVNAAWRVVLANTEIPSVRYVVGQPDLMVTTGRSITQGSTLYFRDTAVQGGPDFVASSVTPGDLVVVSSVSGFTLNNLTVTTVTGLVTGQFYRNTGSATITIGDQSVLVGGVVKALSATTSIAASNPNDLVGSWTVDEITNSKNLKLEGLSDLLNTDNVSMTYYIVRTLTRRQRAEIVAANSATFRSNRVWHVQPDIVGVNVNGQVKYLPGYYLCAAMGGMTAGFPVQQGFTNISVAGIDDLQNGNFYFTKEDLNIMAEAGTCLYVQDTQRGIPYCRHELTTDMTVLEYREIVKVKNWDFLSFFYYDKIKGFIGSWNITPETLTNIKQTLIASSELLLTQRLPRIGAPLLSYEIPTVEQDAVNLDTVNVRLPIATVTPNNYTNLYLVI